MTPTFRAGFGLRASVNAPNSPLGTLSGTVQDTILNPVTAGTIILLQSNVEVSRTTPSGSGLYSFPGRSPGAYTVRHEPAYNKSINDAGQFNVTINAGLTTTQNFSARDALFANNMQAITTAGIANTTAPAVSTHPMFGYPAGSQSFVALDSAGGQTLTAENAGPAGSIVYRHSWDGTTGTPVSPANCTNDNTTCAVSARGTFSGIGAQSELWWSILTLCSSNYRNGGANCVGSQREHKFMWFSPYQTTGGNSTIDIQMDINIGAAEDQLQMRFKIVNNNNSKGATSDGITPPLDKALGSGVFNNWRRHTGRISGLNTGTQTLEYYYNEETTPGITLTTDALAGLTLADLLFFAPFNRNMNNHPDRAIYVDWREVGIYTSRPSGLNTPG